MSETSIEWTDFSINPLRARLGTHVGHYCEKTSPGCKNCYSSRLQPRFGMPQFQEQRQLDVTTFLDPSKLREVLTRRIPTKWFWCDMTDMFGDWVTNEMIAACFGVMAATPWHTHQVLTKRAKRMRQWFEWIQTETRRQSDPSGAWTCTYHAQQLGLCDGERSGHGSGWPLPNVHLGISAEDQARADERIPDLIATPAAVHFVSAEPLIGPLDLTHMDVELAGNRDFCVINALTGRQTDMGRPCPDVPSHLDWVIVGGESGQKARECDVAWIRSIIRQCKDANVACFVKQLGARPLVDAHDTNPNDWGGDVLWDEHGPVIRTKHKKGGDITEWAPDLRVRQFPEARV